MKRLLTIMVAGLMISGTASAQTKITHKRSGKKHSTSKKSTVASSSGHAALNQRKIYHWKNGQSATPAGNEATGINETQTVSKESDKPKGGGKRGHGSQK